LPFTRIEHQWAAFHGFDETASSFVLYLTAAKKSALVRYHGIPKRAFSSPQQLEAFRELITSSIHAHESAFPVSPPKSG